MKIQNNKNAKNIPLLTIVVITAVIVGGVVALDEKIFEPANAQESVIASTNTSPQITTVQWPPAVNTFNSPNIQQNPPQHITVVIGINNTVNWINTGKNLEWVSADNASDSDFAKAAPVFVSPSSPLPSEYTFERSISVGPEETQVFYKDNDSGQEKSFFTTPMKFASNILTPGKNFEYTFTHAGTFGYHDRPWVRGYVTVLEGGKMS